MSAFSAAAGRGWPADPGKSGLPAGLVLTVVLLAGLSMGIAFVDPVIGLTAFAVVAAGPLMIVAVARPELVLYGLVAVTALNLSDIFIDQFGRPGIGKPLVAVAALFLLLHALRFGKVFIFDRETIFIGSLNLDPRSVDINTEMGIVFHSPEMAGKFAHELDKDALEHVYELKLVRSPAESKGEYTTYTWDIEWLERVDGETIRHTSEPGVGVWESIKLFFSGFAPESLI